jgi:GH15 family glucan-1,4-alpha-glucosidase
MVKQPSIKELALIGDQQSCALVDKEGTIAWYCLWRFDQPSLFSLLIDNKGGWWTVEAEGKVFRQRQYKDDSAVLLSEFTVKGGTLTITDFMPTVPELSGICRLFSPAPVTVRCSLFPTPGFGRSRALLKQDGSFLVREEKFEFYIKASHPLLLHNGVVEMEIPAGENGWCVLMDEKRSVPHINRENLQQALSKTVEKWQAIMQNISYKGPYQEVFYQSYKAIQLMTHAHSGGILAAATTSLPEIIGGSRNYDYRYVWLRDTAMDVSALIRAGSKGNEAERFLDFLCAGRNTNKKNLFVPFYDLDHKTAPDEAFFSGTGYKGSTPLRTGNGAHEQLQLDAQGNVLLAAKEIYSNKKEKPHWKTIVQTADYLAKNWQEKDHGIWEENPLHHYTSSKVLVAKSLEFLAEQTDDKKQQKKWLDTAQQIRLFVSRHCMTSDGAYAVYAGSGAVDITAALYAVWWYDKPDSPAMKKTIDRIEAEYRDGDLYRRHLVEADAKEEGCFLAGCLWMAQYYLTLKNNRKAVKIIEAVLGFATDLGFLPEEGDVKTGEPLGNIPQTFVHASLMGVILDYRKAMENNDHV